MGLPPTIETASIGVPDTLFLMLLALVVFGPRRLPEIGRQIGKLMYEFRKVSNDFKYQMEEELRASEEADRQKKLQAAMAAQAPVTLNVPVQPVAEAAPLELGTGAAETEAAAVEGEVRGTAELMPPTSGVVVAAQKPFRGRAAETPETVTESGAEAERTADQPVVVEDEGRIGTEVQPGTEEGLTAESERESSHA